MKIVEHDKLRNEITGRLYDDQSPEAIAGHIRRRHILPLISKNAVYRFVASVHGRRVEAYRNRKRKRRRTKRTKSPKLSNRTFINKRPQIAQNRGRVGDAEADFVVSGKMGRGILLVVVDRKTRMAFLEKIMPVSITTVEQAFLRVKTRYPEIKSVTTDNDILFARHERLAALLGIRIFFCHPYHSWEKGTVENTNKVIRRDVLKGSDISRYSKRFIRRLEEKLNRRPMKCLGYRTPKEVMNVFRKQQNKKQPR